MAYNISHVTHHASRITHPITSYRTTCRVARRRENMLGVNMVLAEFVKFKHGLYRSCGIECFEGIMLEPCLLQPCFHFAGSRQSYIHPNHSIPQDSYSPCLHSTNFARAMFTPTVFSRRRKRSIREKIDPRSARGQSFEQPTPQFA